MSLPSIVAVEPVDVDAEFPLTSTDRVVADRRLAIRAPHPDARRRKLIPDDRDR